MNLTNKEKAKIFWALLEKYPEHERGRRQAKEFFKDKPEELKKHIGEVNESEKESYKLILRFAKELNQRLPAYKEPKEN